MSVLLYMGSTVGSSVVSIWFRGVEAIGVIEYARTVSSTKLSLRVDDSISS